MSILFKMSFVQSYKSLKSQQILVVTALLPSLMEALMILLTKGMLMLGWNPLDFVLPSLFLITFLKAW